VLGVTRLVWAGVVLCLTTLTAEAQNCSPGPSYASFVNQYQQRQQQMEEPREQRAQQLREQQMEQQRQQRVQQQREQQMEQQRQQQLEQQRQQRVQQQRQPQLRQAEPGQPVGAARTSPSGSRTVGSPAGSHSFGANVGVGVSRPGVPPARDPRARAYVYHGQSLAPFHAARYRWPANTRYRRYTVGLRFPLELLVADYLISNWADYGLVEPQEGYQWVRYGPDVLMVDEDTGEVGDAAYGTFVDSADMEDEPAPSSDVDSDSTVASASAGASGATGGSGPAGANLTTRTAGDLAELCGSNPRQADANTKINFCQGFAQGAVSVALIQAGNHQPFCFPNPPPTRAETMGEFVRWEQAAPDRRSMSSVAGLFQFLGQRFPCD
jgi:Ni/Co efflux regulator RcnB